MKFDSCTFRPSSLTSSVRWWTQGLYVALISIPHWISSFSSNLNTECCGWSDRANGPVLSFEGGLGYSCWVGGRWSQGGSCDEEDINRYKDCVNQEVRAPLLFPMLRVFCDLTLWSSGIIQQSIRYHSIKPRILGKSQRSLLVGQPQISKKHLT